MDNEVLQQRVNTAVANGAALLDEKQPGWERMIDLSVLELFSSSCRCILGQLYGSYGTGKECLDILWSAGPYGFVTNCGTDARDEGNCYCAEEYAALDEAWISLIKTRFDTGALSDA